MFRMTIGRSFPAFIAIALLFAAITDASAEDNTKALIQSYNATGGRLAGELGKTRGNLVLSPYSIGVAMSMALTGARGETEKQMSAVLAQRLPRSEMDAANAQVLARLDRSKPPTGDKGVETKLFFANALFLGQNGAMIGDDYAGMLADKYRAQVFRKAGLEEINAWVREKTEGKIDGILQSLSPNSAAVLLNAIYFKGAWAESFPKESTKDEPFHLSATEQVPVATMHRSGSYAAIEESGFKAIRLPYADPGLGMIIVVPENFEGTAALSEQLSGERLAKLVSTLAVQPLRSFAVSVPRFKIAYQADLIAAFRGLGMTLPFDSDHADFTGMTGKPNLHARLSIAQIVHKATLEVTEEGTEAAASTAVEMYVRSVRVPNPFAVDRPFLFFIADKTTGAILFEGRVSDPR